MSQIESPKKHLSAGGWTVMAAMVALLAVSILYAADIWTSIDAQMSGIGWGMLIAGVVVSVLLGGGLMALVFYSSRNDYDR
jgi:hypothetical protein